MEQNIKTPEVKITVKLTKTEVELLYKSLTNEYNKGSDCEAIRSILRKFARANCKK